MGVGAPALWTVENLTLTELCMGGSSILRFFLSGESANQGLRITVVFTTEKGPHTNGPSQFIPVLFKDHLYGKSVEAQ